MSGFNFDSAKSNLVSINQYLESQGVELSNDDKTQLNSIFTGSDTYDDKQNAKGQDGVLNNDEWNSFMRALGQKLPKLIKSLEFFKSDLNRNIMKNSAGALQNSQAHNVAKRDATYVAKLDQVYEIKNSNTTKPVKTMTKEEIVSKMADRWKKAFPQSNVDEKFYNKLYDTLKILKCSISDKDFDSEKYSCKEEQAMDEVCAIFAGEAQLNTKTIGYVKRRATFYGLFQLSSQGLNTAKAWAAKHPDVEGMSSIKPNMTLSKFRNLPADEQLDYLVAYIGASKDASKINANETISPSKLWSMIKLPNLNEEIPQKKLRRERTIEQKQDSIQKIIQRADKRIAR